MARQNSTTLRTEAWLLKGIGNKAGLLELSRGHLAFTAEDGRVFESPVADVTDIKFPWYYFGGGMKMQIGGQNYRISFVRPNGADEVSGRMLADSGAGAAAGLLTAGQSLMDVGTGRQAGKAWRAVLTAGTS